jgi:hypothetical protein
MTNQQADLNGRSHSGRRGVGLHILIDRANFPAKPSYCAGETIAMDAVDSRREITLAGVVARTLSACRVICSIDRLLSALLAVLAALVLVGLLGTQALAHDGHDLATGASGVEAVASTYDDAPSSVSAIADAANCGGHCCFSSLCCPAVALALEVSPVRPHPAAPAAGSAVYLIAAGPPDGPRRPPKTRL